jgi:Response regulator containing CheY-like receiver domain and AraC-type DNA-binding domain
MLKIFLVDDEYYERLSLKQNIPWAKQDMQVVGEASNGKTAFDEICKLQPQIAIVDINMPGYNGLTLISKLNDANINCQYIILTGYDEFKYAQEAVHLGVSNYILKPINYENLIKTLNSLKDKITNHVDLSTQINTLQTENEILHLEHYYNDLVNCNLTWQSLYQQDDSLAQNFHPNYSAFQIAVMEISPCLSRKNLRVVQKQICSNTENSHYICCLDNMNRFFFIFDAKNIIGIITQMEQMKELLSPQYTSFIGIGKTYAKFEEVYLSYSEACMALQNTSIFKKEIILYEELSESLSIPIIDSSVKNKLRTYIFNYNFPALETLLKQIYIQFAESKTPWNATILQTMELMSLLSEILSAHSGTVVSFLDIDENILNKLNHMKSLPELESWIINVYKTTIKNTLDLQQAYSNVTLSIETYIQNNYHDSTLTIDMIAKTLFLNYRYICHCFKRDKNITINDYLNKIRIAHAIELFKGNVTNVGYVAEKCGFSSASYFSKQFKRSTGLSPKDFIKTFSLS